VGLGSLALEACASREVESTRLPQARPSFLAPCRLNRACCPAMTAAPRNATSRDDVRERVGGQAGV